MNTAVTTPVVAVIEYNYEQNGEMVIPAGAKAFGHLEAADRSGYVGIRFDSLMLPDGASVSLEDAATDKECERLCELIDDKGLKKLLRAFDDLEAQIKNRPLSVWGMKMVAASTMELLEKMTDAIIVPEFTLVD